MFDPGLGEEAKHSLQGPWGKIPEGVRGVPLFSCCKICI